MLANNAGRRSVRAPESSTNPPNQESGMQKTIRELDLNLPHVSLCGIVIAKQSPRKITTTNSDGTEQRCVLNFTLRDSPQDTINVSVWGNTDPVIDFASLFHTGDCVTLHRAQVKPRNTEREFGPDVTSPYQLNIRPAQECISMCEEETSFYLYQLAHVPFSNIISVMPLADLNYCNTKANLHATFLVAVFAVGQPMRITTRDNRQAFKMEVFVFDSSIPETVSLTIWDTEVQRLAAMWTPRVTVMMLSDARIIVTPSRGASLMWDGRTVATIDPTLPEARHLAYYARTAVLPQPNLGRTDNLATMSTTVYTCRTLGREIEKRRATGYTGPLTGIIYPIIKRFNIDDPQENITSTFCTGCRMRVPSGLPNCCPGATTEVQWDITVIFVDHTGTLSNTVRVCGDAAMQLMHGTTVEKFRQMTAVGKANLKWRTLMERFKIHFKIIFRGMEQLQKPTLFAVNCEYITDFQECFQAIIETL